MFPRLAAAASGADLYQDATTTLRSAFPNSRLDSLAAHPTPAVEQDSGLDSQLATPPEHAGADVGYNPELDDDWWSNAIEVDTFDSPLAFDASENGLWNGHFVPPPPRPPFLDESVAADGLTTCDLCTWAWQRNAYSLDGSIGKWEMQCYSSYSSLKLAMSNGAASWSAHCSRVFQLKTQPSPVETPYPKTMPQLCHRSLCSHR